MKGALGCLILSKASASLRFSSSKFYFRVTVHFFMRNFLRHDFFFLSVILGIFLLIFALKHTDTETYKETHGVNHRVFLSPLELTQTLKVPSQDASHSSYWQISQNLLKSSV